MTRAYLSFVAFVAQDFENFLFQLQKREPMIHMLYCTMTNLLVTLLHKFALDANMKQVNDGQLKPAAELAKLDVTKKASHKKLSSVEIGTKTRVFLAEDRVSELDAIIFRKNCLQFYATSVSLLHSNLPFDSIFLKDVQIIHPEKRHTSNALNKISRLSLKIMEPLNKVLRNAIGQSDSHEELCDNIRREWKHYECDEKLPSFVSNNDVSDNKVKAKQESYWKRVHEEFGLQFGPTNSTPEAPNMKRIDVYWQEVSQMKDETGEVKYPLLTAMVKTLLTLSHGNAAPESGFSINKAMLVTHGNSLDEETLSSLRIVKDAIIHAGSFLNIPITRKLLISVKNSYQRYKADLEAKKKMEDEMKHQKELALTTIGKRKLEHEDIVAIDHSISLKKMGISVAEESISDANVKLQAILKASTISRVQVQRAQSSLEMGLQRKRVLEEEVIKLSEERERIKKTKKA